jgi:hypothetical protein
MAAKMSRINQRGRFTEFIYILGKTRRSVNEEPHLRAGARADRAALFAENG